MLFEKMNWMDVEEYLKHENRVVLVVGSCEQHGYLSLTTDTLEPFEIAKVACEKENILIAPTINYGINPFFNAYPGNISLKPETFSVLIRDVVKGLISHGFKRILVSNGHGGNTGVLVPILCEISNKHPECNIKLFQWWLDPEVDRVATEAGFKQSHANWSENHKFTRVCETPDNQKPFVTIPKVSGSVKNREILGDGCYGGQYKAPDELMNKFFDTAVNVMIQELKFM